MKRPLQPEELKLWAVVARTVRPAPGRRAPEVPDAPTLSPPPQTLVAKAGPAAKSPAAPAPSTPSRAWRHEPEPLEPRRLRRLSRERDPIEARIDLHGLDQFAAEDRLKAFLRQAQASGLRAVLVITGKGLSGDGILRRRAPEWLASPTLRHVVAGVATAHRRHGGDGALYVALKRPHAPRP